MFMQKLEGLYPSLSTKIGIIKSSILCSRLRSKNAYTKFAKFIEIFATSKIELPVVISIPKTISETPIDYFNEVQV